MNINPTPVIPGWNYDYSMLNENDIEEEENRIAEKAKEIFVPAKLLRNPGFESQEGDDNLSEEDDEVEEDDDDDYFYPEDLERYGDGEAPGYDDD